VTRYLDLAEYFVLAELVTGVPAETLTKASRVDLAGSALHAPQAGFGDKEFYPDVFDKARCCVGGWLETIRCLMATSGQRGSRCRCSSS
jgi:hypothetical protein